MRRDKLIELVREERERTTPPSYVPRPSIKVTRFDECIYPEVDEQSIATRREKELEIEFIKSELQSIKSDRDNRRKKLAKRKRWK